MRSLHLLMGMMVLNGMLNFLLNHCYDMSSLRYAMTRSCCCLNDTTNHLKVLIGMLSCHLGMRSLHVRQVQEHWCCDIHVRG